MKKNVLIFICAIFLIISETRAQEESSYIDQIKTEIKKENVESDENYYEKIKNILKREVDSRGYTENIRNKLKEKETSENYSEKIKEQIKPAESGSAIADVKSGKLGLDPLEFEKASSAFGVKVGATISNNIVSTGSGATGRTIAEIYGDSWYPDVSVFYEWFPFNSRYFGNLGVRIGAGLIIIRGKGKFQVTPSNNLNTFNNTSQTEFRFAYVPLQISGNYRFNFLKYIKPTVQMGALMIPYEEGRNDGIDSKRGFSTSLIFGGGVSILLNWISGESRFSLYRAHAIKSYYLNIEYKVITALSGTVQFASSGLYAGFSFDI